MKKGRGQERPGHDMTLYAAAFGTSRLSNLLVYGHPVANWLLKHMKSITFSVGGAVLPSQLA
jgi:hypothetical protein